MTAVAASSSASSRADFRSLPLPPGPAPSRLLGPVPSLLRFRADAIGAAGRIFAKYGPLASLVQGPAHIMSPMGRGVALANGPDLNRQVLTEHDRFHSYALPGRFYPSEEDLAHTGSRGLRATAERLMPIRRTLTGLFHVNSDEHRRHRRLLQPAFHKRRIEAYRDDMVAITGALLDEWRAGQQRDVHADLTELTLRIATKTLFGEDAGDRGVALARRMQDWLVTMFSMGMMLPFDVAPLPYHRWLDLTRAIDDETAAILRQKQASVAARLAKGEEVGADMLSMLIAARDDDGSALDDDELVGHTGVIFAAGHETSTNALAWTLFLLAMHPDVASELTGELRSVLKGDAPTVEQLAQLPLLDAVVKESLRILPPVPLHPRIVAEDMELGGHYLPKYTELFLSIFHIHHDPAIFAAPRRFKPSRWASIKPSVYEYNPFSAGPRMCIGAAFATMEIKIALAMLLQRFRVELLPHTQLDRRVAITMAPKGGLPIVVRPADDAWRTGPRDVRGDIHELVELPS